MTPRSLRGRLGAAAAGILAVALVPALTHTPASAEPGGTDTQTDPRDVLTLGDPVHGLADVDLRGAAAPLASQREALGTLGEVEARWNTFGTPASLLPADGSLGQAPGSPAEGARAWLRSNAAVFGLDAAQVDALELVNSQQLYRSPARAVLFRQRLGDLVPATGGMVTVGVSDGQVRYVSSSLTRAEGAPAEPALTPLEGWLAAAADVGRAVTAGDVDAITVTAAAADGDWTRLEVPGLSQEQQVRLRALGMADGGVRPVFEANVVDVAGGSALAHTVLVDAVSGEVLVRRNQVDNHQAVESFTGSFTATECGPRHPFELTDDKTRSIVLSANALPVDDVTIKLFDPSGDVVFGHDLLTSPDAGVYSADSIPAGTYAAQVCPYDAASAVVGQYQLTVATSDAALDAGAAAMVPRWRYFPANPTLDSAEETPANSVVGCWTLEEGCDTPPGALDNVAAFGPWDTVAGGSAPTGTTVGNNASTHEAWASPLTPGGLFQAPVSPTREYTAEFTDAWNNNRCDPASLVPGGNDIDASVTNLFAAHNRMHDFSYYLGFTEENYNMQLENGGRGGVAGDPEVGNAQAGALSGGTPSYLGRDNANQITLQDGVPGITNQYLFQPIAGAFYAPCTDGGLDMGIVGHEYTHAISNRMVGGPDDGLTTEQGGAMGESWSDLVAAEYHVEHGYSNGGNVWAVGVYATGNEDVAIRDYAINRNPLNYSNYGFDSTGPEVHADGEIWNGTQWEVRQALVEKWNATYPASDQALQQRCAGATGDRTPHPVELCPGNRRWLQLMFDSFLLQQGSTSMLDARDAMIAADRMRFGGENERVLWEAYARRGMGRDASITDGDDHEPTPSFASPVSSNETITFETSRPSRIYVGHYEARSTAVADTLEGTALDAAAELTAGRYDMLAVSEEGGATPFTLTVDGTGQRTVKVDDRVNLASAAAGASVLSATEGSLNADHLIDGTEATNWGGVTEENVDTTNPSVAVDLVGDVQTVGSVQVSAMLTPAPADPNAVPLAVEDPDSGSRFTALRQFALEACTTACDTEEAVWTRFYTSPADAFPSVAPRPVAPDLRMRAFDVPDTEAAAVRLVTLHNQCTGYAGYAGEQDDDPTNDTDCATASDRGTIVHASELQVFAADKGHGPSPKPSPGPTEPSDGPVAGSTPPGSGAGGVAAAGPAATSLEVRLRRAVQRPGRAAPRLVAHLLADGQQDLAGRLLVKIDGRTYRRLEAAPRVALTIRRALDVGRHRVRVVFRPADRELFAPARSHVLRITVRR